MYDTEQQTIIQFAAKKRKNTHTKQKFIKSLLFCYRKRRVIIFNAIFSIPT